ncbi:MAG TPA: hypothetical protein PKD78_11260, partial [Saprospiraceae bacterium]|nr:hypothetical protein [Saprospiraceae bacterium]
VVEKMGWVKRSRSEQDALAHECSFRKLHARVSQIPQDVNIIHVTHPPDIFLQRAVFSAF